MKTMSPQAQEIWDLIKEYRKDMQESRKEREESQKKYQKDMQESQKEREESQKKYQKEREEFQKEWKKGMQELRESQQKTDLQMKKTDRQIQKIGGRFNERWGALVESLVEGKMVPLFKEKGIDVTETYSRAKSEKEDSEGVTQRREADIIVANGKEVVLVEVKTTLTLKDVRVFLESLKEFKNYFHLYKSKVLYGAMAYLKAENRAQFLAEEKGLFIIEATGDSARIVNKQNFQPKVFL